MNGYNLTRGWYNYKFDNPDKVKHIHSDLYFYLLDRWNRLGQKEKFGLPTQVTMEAMGIGSYNTYKKALSDLIDFGFVKEVSKAKNQYQSRVIALSKIDKATDESLDKALVETPDESTDTIIEQENIELLKQNTEWKNLLKKKHSIGETEFSRQVDNFYLVSDFKRPFEAIRPHFANWIAKQDLKKEEKIVESYHNIK